MRKRMREREGERERQKESKGFGNEEIRNKPIVVSVVVLRNQ